MGHWALGIGHWALGIGASPYAPEGGLRLWGGYAYGKNCLTIQNYLDGLLAIPL